VLLIDSLVPKLVKFWGSSSALGEAALYLVGESPTVEGKLDHYVASLASPAATKETKRRQRNNRAEIDR
jgi:hypothetical protein